MKFPIQNIRTAATALVAVASIALVAACSADDPEPTPTVLPHSPEFITSEDCNDLVHGGLSLTKLQISGERLSTAPTLPADGPSLALTVEVADEPSERAQGLMCRETIPSGIGMLFTYAHDQSTAFWMYNTYAPIDIFYVDNSGLVVDRIRMSPCLRDGLTDDDWQVKCATEAVEYVPRAAYRYVLELPAGWKSDLELFDPDTFDLRVTWDEIESG
ncbi:MAG: hypothetical protein HOJ22_08090 [Chloroflexi bacterium]|nr:hypothetical protein [Chloroflexota bacterium]MBT5628236.1 hypothetical protein [Chloroflexota bacterium]